MADQEPCDIFAGLLFCWPDCRQRRAGSRPKLQYQVDVAKIDYRDILVFADRPLPTAEEAAKDLAAAKEVLRLWGKK